MLRSAFSRLFSRVTREREHTRPWPGRETNKQQEGGQARGGEMEFLRNNNRQPVIPKSTSQPWTTCRCMPPHNQGDAQHGRRPKQGSSTTAQQNSCRTVWITTVTGGPRNRSYKLATSHQVAVESQGRAKSLRCPGNGPQPLSCASAFPRNPAACGFALLVVVLHTNGNKRSDMTENST